VLGHHAPDVLEAVERELAERRLQRPVQEARKLDKRQAEMLPGAAGQPAAGGVGQIGKGDGDVGEGDPLAVGQEQLGQIAEPPAGTQRHRRR